MKLFLGCLWATMTAAYITYMLLSWYEAAVEKKEIMAACKDFNAGYRDARQRVMDARLRETSTWYMRGYSRYHQVCKWGAGASQLPAFVLSPAQVYRREGIEGLRK